MTGEVFSKLTAELFAKMVLGGANSLNESRETINDLNVFPIPDGDTGDNMYMTISSGIVDYSSLSGFSLSETTEQISRGMLLGARGNSGVILSRIFAGISEGFSSLSVAGVKEMDYAMKCGVKEAYGSVSVPVEGTILTVFREGVDFASKNISENSTVDSYLSDLIRGMNDSLERTPDLLDILKEAGVVDSGGAGLIKIAEGMKDALYSDVSSVAGTMQSSAKKVDLSKFGADDELTFGYCTEFLLRLTNAKVDTDTFDESIFKDYLEKNGDSLVFFRDGSIIKVHVHTKEPGTIMSEALKYGEFLTVKVENMNLQHNETHAKKEEKKVVKHKKYGIVAVSSGEGIKETFLSLGIDNVVDGGQCMNPSAEDLIKAVENTNADTVFLFPNNSNIILTAKQASSMIKDTEVVVIPTKSIGECYAAVSMWDTSSDDKDEIAAQTMEIISSAVTGEISKATKDTTFGEKEIKKDDYIGISGGKILCSKNDKNEALVETMRSLNAGSFDIILLIYGKETSEADAANAEKAVSEAFPRSEVYLINGGQPVYDYIITLE